VDAVDTSPYLGGQNVLKTFEMAIRHNRRTTRPELEREFSLSGFIFTYLQKYFYGPLTVRVVIAPIAPPLAGPLCMCGGDVRV